MKLGLKIAVLRISTSQKFHLIKKVGFACFLFLAVLPGGLDPIKICHVQKSWGEDCPGKAVGQRAVHAAPSLVTPRKLFSVISTTTGNHYVESLPSTARGALPALSPANLVATLQNKTRYPKFTVQTEAERDTEFVQSSGKRQPIPGV